MRIEINIKPTRLVIMVEGELFLVAKKDHTSWVVTESPTPDGHLNRFEKPKDILDAFVWL